MFAHSKVGIVNVFLDSRARRHKSCPWPAAKGLKHLCKFASKQKIRSQLEGAAAFSTPQWIFIHRTPAREFPLQLARLAENSHSRGKTKVLSLRAWKRLSHRAKEDSGKCANGSSEMQHTSHTLVRKQSLFLSPQLKSACKTAALISARRFSCRNNGPVWS